MIVKCLFATRKGNEDGLPELLMAWDEWTVENNEPGFRLACEDAMRMMGDELDSHRYVHITLADNAVEKLFETATIAGTAS